MMVFINKFDRSQRVNIFGQAFNQEALRKSHIVVVGSGPIAEWYIIGGVCLGLGKITHVNVLETPSKYLPISNIAPETKECIKKVVSQLNAPFHETLHTKYRTAANIKDVAGAAVVIDCTNNLSAESDVIIDFVTDNTLPVVCCHSNNNAMLVMNLNGLREYTSGLTHGLFVDNFYNSPQGNFTSCMAAMLALEETRKHIAPFLDQKGLPREEISQKIYYTSLSKTRFDGNTDVHGSDDTSLRNEVIYQMGAGATGQIAILLAMDGVKKYYIADGDTINPTNFNRQFYLLGGIGFDDSSHTKNYKATTVSTNLKKISDALGHKTEFIHITEHVNNNSVFSDDITCFIAATDNARSRAILHRASLKRKLPAINIGSSSTGSHGMVYVPDLTACLDHVDSVLELEAYELNEIAAGRSVDDPCQPSLVMPPLMAASFAVGELRAAKINGFGPPVTGKLNYIQYPKTYLSVSPCAPCNCHKGDYSQSRTELTDLLASRYGNY